MMKKLVLFVLSLSLLLGALAACTATEPPTSPATEATAADDSTQTSLPTDTLGIEESDTQAAIETETNTEKKEENSHMLDGKKFIFVGNSFTYYGKTVLEKTQSVLTQSARSNDKGYFYQLCKANGADVSVTNWTFGGHNLYHLFEECTANRGCDGVDHASYLTDRSFDYVVFQEGSTDISAEVFAENCQRVMTLFREANPDVKFVFLVPRRIHELNRAWLPAVKDLEEQGVTIVDWGALVDDLITGTVTVPGGTQTYEQNSFIVRKSASDGYHPNMLTGYVTTLMTYCAITGESAVGQTDAFCNDSSLNSHFNFQAFINKYYTYNNATTNFPAIFSSKADMDGIRELIDRYLQEKAYRTYGVTE